MPVGRRCSADRGEAGMSTLTRQLSGGREMVRTYNRRVGVPMLGEVAVPPPDKLAYYAGLGVLAALQVIEWPLALVITAGHVLADQHMSGLVKGLGEALQSA
ncbi:hypothetical protein DLJ46_26115 [Micromonospora globispora]|uniref:Uncharacterized protein n=2 Tax=Micromonospora globispora TaxID=1450148 RepID=A0A317JUE6_9ACTN|nr:hypothetical protein [Micromonospora globispora]PWU44411.1 hypothetical protein DLJ46_26115 [Micromonospora globispora]RQW83708.1 hypothetical protein DKL51_31335 [Micromonospora globispora]